MVFNSFLQRRLKLKKSIIYFNALSILAGNDKQKIRRPVSREKINQGYEDLGRVGTLSFIARGNSSHPPK
jgi:hypothetical protein